MISTLRAILDAAVAAVGPAACLPAHLPADDRPSVVGGAGKAAASMAQVFEARRAAPLAGIVVTRYGHGLPGGERLRGIEILEAGHPIPDRAGVTAGQRILELARRSEAGHRFIFLLSGGASALLEVPAPGLTLSDIQTVNRELLAAGAEIGAINCVRKKLSAIKGGRLALAAAPAEVLVLAISDVPGDALGDIGSGPCSPDTTSLADARQVLRQHGCRATARIWAALNDSRNETPGPDHPVFAQATGRIVARSADALAAAAAAAEAAGFEPVMLGDASESEARALARTHAELVRAYGRRGGRYALISGGEATVRVVNPSGQGGPNTAYLLSLALALGESSGTWALAADTDGIDGTGDNAGAVLTPDSLQRAARQGLDPGLLLRRDDSARFFAALGNLVVTGPTRTNVNDLRVLLVG